MDLYYNEIDSIPELSFENLKSIDLVWCDKITSQVQEFKKNINKNYPDIIINTEETVKNTQIDTWESIKETYFSWNHKGETLSWNPNEFFNDNEQYEQRWLVSESTNSGLSKAKKELKIEDKWDSIFYSERKRSDWTVSVHVFVRKEKKTKKGN